MPLITPLFNVPRLQDDEKPKEGCMYINTFGEWVLGDYALASNITTEFRRTRSDRRDLHTVAWLLERDTNEDYHACISVILGLVGREGQQNTFRVLDKNDDAGRTPTDVIDLYPH